MLAVVFCVMLLVLHGCGSGSMTWQQQLNSSAGVERVQGIMTVGERNIRPAIGQLIGRLGDDDVSVRLAAARTLREMTGKHFGYVAWADEHHRRGAAARWRAWWSSETRSEKKTPGPKPGDKP